MTPNVNAPTEVLAVNNEPEHSVQPSHFDEFEGHDDDRVEDRRHTTPWDWDEDVDW